MIAMSDISKIALYHIVNIDRLGSILSSGYLYSDVDLTDNGLSCGTSIAYEHIRERRRRINVVDYPDLTIGACVPFYFGKHSPMLYRAMKGPAQGYDYAGGQDPIVYLVFMLTAVLKWAENNAARWIFTDRNASDGLAQQFSSLEQLGCLNWEIIRAKFWQGNADLKAAEFLIEHKIPVRECLLGIVARVPKTKLLVEQLLKMYGFEKPVKLCPGWYF